MLGTYLTFILVLPVRVLFLSVLILIAPPVVLERLVCCSFVCHSPSRFQESLRFRHFLSLIHIVIRWYILIILCLVSFSFSPIVV